MVWHYHIFSVVVIDIGLKKNNTKIYELPLTEKRFFLKNGSIIISAIAYHNSPKNSRSTVIGILQFCSESDITGN